MTRQDYQVQKIEYHLQKLTYHLGRLGCPQETISEILLPIRHVVGVDSNDNQVTKA